MVPPYNSYNLSWDPYWRQKQVFQQQPHTSLIYQHQAPCTSCDDIDLCCCWEYKGIVRITTAELNYNPPYLLGFPNFLFKKAVHSIGTCENGEPCMRLLAFLPYVFIALVQDNSCRVVDMLGPLELYGPQVLDQVSWMQKLVCRKAWRINCTYQCVACLLFSHY